MPSPHTDRNLLFGILALQMDFISRNALIQAMNAWVLEKAKPLEQILLDRKALSPDTHALLQALVAKHLEMHQSDPEKSLASVSSIGSVREELRLLADDDIDASLACVATARMEGDPQATRPFVAGEHTSAGLRFRILRPHDKGGLGEVFVAEDEELHREVALKEIQEQYADDPQARARFLLEAEITGGLEHPGIVPVYGLGQYADGRPFYAMRFIKGDNLKNAIDRFHKAEGPHRDAGERTLEFRKLLRRFQDVCNAVDYAHSRGVLHRDLKPGNIMLGQYGETLVVDWGLAKTLNQSGPDETTLERPIRAMRGGDSEPTKMGSAVGTPAFMSPEQASGRLDLMGPTSDVYSLGATLYSLLTGQAPFQGNDQGEVLGKVQQGDFLAPKQVKATVPAALEAICLKAMKLKPEDRYPSPRELTGDIDHWLADERVAAYAEPPMARLRRWARKHRTLVASAGMLLVTATLGLGVGLAVVNHEKNLKELARQDAEGNLELANANLSLAKKAVDDLYLLATEDPLLKQENMRKVRRMLLERALPFYEGFRVQRSDDRGIRAELAKTYYNVGFITAEIGRSQDAQRAYQAAKDLFQQLDQEVPEVAEYQSALAGTHHNLGVLQKEGGDRTGAAKSYDVALAIQMKLTAEHPDVTQYQRSQALSLTNLGVLQNEAGDRQSAAKSYKAALEIRKKLAAGHPDVTQYQRDLAGSYNNVGNLQMERGDRPGAAKSYGLALAIQKKLAADHPDLARYQNDLAGGYYNLANLQQEGGDRLGAAKSYQAALVIQKKLVADYPEVIEYQSDLARSYNNLGIQQMGGGDRREAAKSYEAALAIRKKLAADHSEAPDYHNDLAGTLVNLGILKSDEKAWASARDYLDQALPHHRAALKINPRNPEYRQFLRDNRSIMLTVLFEMA
ncbi:MAG TPA: serine/threonine-protein kinase, partial [Gemmataceae bacterium]|nr:serine/threonine-protein kinase [Gemmataceae bacterium]